MNFIKLFFQLILCILLFFVFLFAEQELCADDFNILKFETRYEIDKQRFITTGLEYTKKPIVLFGCSFMYGYMLDYEQTPAYLLSKVSKRPVFSRAHPGYGIQHMLFQLRRDDFYLEVPEPEYCLFLFMKDHPVRLFQKATWWPEGVQYLRYAETKDGNFCEANTFLYSLYRMYIPNKLQLMSANYKASCYTDKNFDLIKKYFINAKQEAEKHWKNTKFVILVYQSDDNFYTETTRWFELKKSGYDIIYLSELNNGVKVDENDCLDDKFHPNGKLWEKVIPKLVKRLNIQ